MSLPFVLGVGAAVSGDLHVLNGGGERETLPVRNLEQGVEKGTGREVDVAELRRAAPPLRWALLEDPNRVSTLMNVRVADMATVYREWNERGAQFLTEPLDNHGAEQRCYLRDPDGYLIELGATTPRTVAA